MDTISFNEVSAKSFVKLYNDSVKENKESFIFQSNEFLKSYAYYVIQHLVANKIIKGSFNDSKIFK